MKNLGLALVSVAMFGLVLTSCGGGSSAPAGNDSTAVVVDSPAVAVDTPAVAGDSLAANDSAVVAQ